MKGVHFFFSFQTSMLGMKRDCGGAAGILGAFRAAVKQVRDPVILRLLAVCFSLKSISGHHVMRGEMHEEFLGLEKCVRG